MSWLGRPLSEELVAAFEARGIDVCGERGEYHTLVTSGPLFHTALNVRAGTTRLDGDPRLGSRFHQLDVQLIGDA